MKLLILFTIISFNSISQFYYIDQEELYKNNKIREVKVYSQDIDSNITKYSYHYKVDEKGNVFYEEDFEEKSIEISLFEDNLLKQEMLIKADSLKTDTLVTTYFYNKKSELIMEIRPLLNLKDTLTVYYDSFEGKLIKSTAFNIRNQREYVDSLVLRNYFLDNLIAKYELYYENDSVKYKDVTFYNKIGNEALLHAYWIKDKKFELMSSKMFFYNDKNQLIVEKKVDLFMDSFETAGGMKIIYEYDKRGFVIKSKTYFDGKISFIDTYEYK